MFWNLNTILLAQLKFTNEQTAWLVFGILLGLVCCFTLGKVVAIILKNRQFDVLFAVPWKPAHAEKQAGGWKASGVVGWAFFLTGLVGLTWGLSQYYKYPHPFINQMLQFCFQAWMLLLTTLAALALARIVASAVISIFQNQTVRNQLELFCPHSEGNKKVLPLTKGELEGIEEETSFPQIDVSENESVKKTIAEFANETAEPASVDSVEQPQKIKTTKPPEAFADSIARIVGLLVYLIVFLPVFMIAAEIWNWSATGEAISDVWRLFIPLAGLAVVVLLGWFAITAALLAVIPARQRKTVIIATTLLAILLLVASYNTAFAIIFAVAIVVVFWVTRNDSPDAIAGWYLQSQANLTAKTPHGAGNVTRVQLLTSDLTTVNGSFRIRNRHILRSYLDGVMIAESYLIPIEEK